VRPVPVEMNTDNVLRKCFAQAGKVTIVECFPDKGHAIVEFQQKVRLCVDLN
jgi:hypothetical protein